MALQLQIASPCTESWDGMVGDDRVRHCALCKLNVYNVREMTEAEMLELITKTEGRVCVRLYARADGTAITQDCPTGLAAARRRVLVGVTMAAALALAVVGIGVAQLPQTTDSRRPLGWAGRVMDAREYLRGTAAFGGVVDEIFPATPDPAGCDQPRGRYGLAERPPVMGAVRVKAVVPGDR
jgi:hypothetical protein